LFLPLPLSLFVSFVNYLLLLFLTPSHSLDLPFP
jgi:hypothetical protein